MILSLMEAVMEEATSWRSAAECAFCARREAMQPFGYIKRAALIVAVLAMLPVAATAHAAGVPSDAAPSATNDFDKAMLTIYLRGQRDLTDGTRPLLIAGGGLTLVTAEETKTYHYTPQLYDDLKSISHIVLGVIGAVTPWPTGHDGEARWRREFGDIKAAIEALVPSLSALGLTAAQLARAKSILSKGDAFVSNALDTGALSPEEVAAFLNSVRAEWLANARDAEYAHLSGLHETVTKLRDEMSPEDWARTIVLVRGSSVVRGNNGALGYFARVMPDQFAARRVMFGENVHGLDDSVKHVGEIMMQRHVGAWVFSDPDRMEIDLLGFEAGSILDEILPGSPPGN
jgi:hypothetical protein